MDVIPGCLYHKNMHKFPEEYKQIFNETDDDNVPLIESLRRSRKAKLATNNSLNKVIPEPDLEQSAGALLDHNRIYQNDSVPSNNTGPLRGLAMINTSAVTDDRHHSVLRTRNRNVHQLSSIIHENEEENKGTIDFRNRVTPPPLEAGRHSRSVSHNGQNSRRDESFEPLIQNILNDTEEAKANPPPRGDLNSIEQLEMAFNPNREESKHFTSREESKKGLDQPPEEKNLSSPDRSSRKRSISAQNPVRLPPRMETVDPRRPPMMENPSNNFFNSHSRRNMSIEGGRYQPDEEIDDLINSIR